MVELSTERETTTSKHITFENNFNSVAVTGLWGCTSIIVISRRGAWVSHIWERAFKEDGPFQEMAIEKVHHGDGTKNHAFGIDELMNNAGVGPRGVIFGDKTDPKDNPKVKVIIVAPRPPAALMDGMRFTSDIFRDNPHVNLNQRPTYKDGLKVIKSDLWDTFGQDLPISVITYALRVETTQQSVDLQDFKSFGQTQKLEEKLEEVRKRLAGPNVKSGRGKLLVQYRPAARCHRAGWRIFVEAPESGARDVDEWGPSPAQTFTEE